MAFSDDQANLIRHYLGFSFYFQDHNPRLEDQLTRVGNDVSAKAIVQAILAELVVADGRLQVLIAVQGGVKKVDEIEFFNRQESNSSIDDVRAYGRMQVGRLSIAMGTPIVGDVFSGKGYEGDAWSNSDFQIGGMGIIPLG